MDESITWGWSDEVLMVIGFLRCFVRYPAVSMCTVSPGREFVLQSTVGLNVWNQGCPRMSRSRPRFVTKNPSFFVTLPCRTQRLQKWVTDPSWLFVPSTLWRV